MKKVITLLIAKKNFIIFSLLNILTRVLGLLTNIFIVRELTVNEYGIFSIALLLINFVTTFGFSWSSSSIVFLGSKERAIYGNIYRTFSSRNIIIIISLLLVTFLFILFNNEINDYVGEDVTFLLLVWLYVLVIQDYLIQYFLSIKKQILSSLMSIAVKIIYLFLVMLLNFDVITLIILNIISNSIVLFFIIAINKDEIGNFIFDKIWFKKVLNYSLWQLFGFSGIYVLNFGDIAVIKYFMTNSDVAIYNVAYSLFAAITALSYVISSYYASNIAYYVGGNNYLKLKSFYYKDRFVILLFTFLIHVLIFIFGEQIILFLYGGQYIKSVLIFKILLFGSLFRYISVFYMIFYNTNDKHKMQQIINIVLAILNVCLNLVLIHPFGVLGPAIATTISIILTCFYSIVYCERAIKEY